jgi:hypothetical protein
MAAQRNMLHSPLIATLVAVMTQVVAQSGYNPETVDDQYGNRVITSIRTSSAYDQPDGIPNEPLCLTVLGRGQIVPGSQVQYAKCESASEITLSNTQRWVISSPALPSGPSSNGTVRIPFTGAGGLGGKGGIGCLTALYDGAAAQSGQYVPLTVEDCDQPENQIWDTRDTDRFMLQAQKGGQAVCMRVDEDSVSLRGGEDGDWWKAVHMEPCFPEGESGASNDKRELSFCLRMRCVLLCAFHKGYAPQRDHR